MIKIALLKHSFTIDAASTRSPAQGQKRRTDPLAKGQHQECFFTGNGDICRLQPTNKDG
jgi:hypothetical protein